jgi:hypothetical protein
MVYIDIPFAPAGGGRFRDSIRSRPSPQASITATVVASAGRTFQRALPDVVAREFQQMGLWKSLLGIATTRTETPVALEVIDGLNHAQEFEPIDRVLPLELACAKQHAR